MSEKESEYRKERIERLLYELQHEVTRGIMENETEEHVVHRFVIPVSRTYPKSGVVFCEFRAHPMEHYGMAPMPDKGPRLRIVKAPG